jgi:undecaprenyl diphosphate synthase
MEAISLKTDSLPPPPRHIAIIMDGNGRWAEARRLPRVAGHKEGAKAVKTTMEAALEMGVSYLTLFGFSSENWKRSLEEVNDLMGLLRYYLKNESKFLHEHNVRFCMIGERDRLAPDIVSLIETIEEETAQNSALTLTVALSYGGRAEIATAAQSLAKAVKTGAIQPDEIDEDLFSNYLYTNGTPYPDLLIRSSGEKRISNFLLWQMAYAEFIFVDTLWPDFTKEDFEAAVKEYHGRERRYGSV